MTIAAVCSPAMIESFCRRNASDCPVSNLLGKGGKRDIRVADMRQIAMDFVAHDQHIMLDAQFGDPFQRLPIPDFADRIVRVAENEQRSRFAGQFFFQIREIDGIASVFIAQFARQDFPTVVQDGIVEDVVDRRKNDNVIAYFRHFPNDRRDGRNDACAIEDPLLFHRELMPPLPPPDDAFPETVRDGIVAESALPKTLFDGVDNSRRRSEVHVRHPHRQLARFDIPLVRVGVPSVDDLIKIEWHIPDPPQAGIWCSRPRFPDHPESVRRFPQRLSCR